MSSFRWPLYTFLLGLSGGIVSSLVFVLQSASRQAPISRTQAWIITLFFLLSLVGAIWTGAKIGSAYNQLLARLNAEMERLSRVAELPAQFSEYFRPPAPARAATVATTPEGQ